MSEPAVSSVLHVITTINRGGAENHLVALIEGQRARGVSVNVAYLKGNGYWTQALQAMGVKVLHLGLQRYGSLSPALRLRRFIAETRPSVVHAHLPPSELYARMALIGIRPQPAFVVSKHNAMQFIKAPGWRLLGRVVGGKAQRMIAISSAVKEYVTQQYRIPAAIVEAVHYGIDTRPYDKLSESSPIREQYGCPPDGWVIGTVARLVPEKNLHMLLDGYARYRQNATRPSRLVIVGAGPLEADLKRHAEKLDLQQHVVWAGFREDIPAVMKSFDLFALTSVTEGFGLVLLEAMAAGKAVAATSVNAIPEVVLEGQTGLLVPSGDAGALAAAFAKLEDQGLRTRFGREGALRARQDFGLDKMVERTLRLYDAARATSRAA